MLLDPIYNLIPSMVEALRQTAERVSKCILYCNTKGIWTSVWQYYAISPKMYPFCAIAAMVFCWQQRFFLGSCSCLGLGSWKLFFGHRGFLELWIKPFKKFIKHHKVRVNLSGFDPIHRGALQTSMVVSWTQPEIWHRLSYDSLISIILYQRFGMH